MKRFSTSYWRLIGGCWLACLTCAQASGDDRLGDVLAQIQQRTPSTAAELTSQRADELHGLGQTLESLLSTRVFSPDDSPDHLATATSLLAAKAALDQSLAQVLALRRDTAAHQAKLKDEDRRRLRALLQTTNTLTDLSGRLRFLVFDAVGGASGSTGGDAEKLKKIIAVLAEHRSGNGAAVMTYWLNEDVDPSVKAAILRLIAVSGEHGLLPAAADIVRDEESTPQLVLEAASTFHAVGLPQPPHPDQAANLPRPVMVADELLAGVKTIDSGRLNDADQLRRDALIKWLTERTKKGVTGDTFRVWGHDLQAGDWLLMRNPSPYNLFTDLSPGLFTHVGVVTTVTPADGIRRVVIVDLPERGEAIPVANAEAYLDRTLHYFFVRHKDPAVAAKMAEAARQMIGNPTQFDLTFQTDRVAQYRDKPLQGERINTYCAGFLMLCAQHAGVPRREVFPIEENPAGGHTAANLKSLGLSVGEHFVSPTGAVFSPDLKIIARRPPMYDPTREVKEAIYDHFAHQMQARPLRQSPDAQQALRQRLAELSEGNPLLKRALAKVSGVSEHMDLVAAAKAAAVVETLDRIADGSMNAYSMASYSMFAGTPQQLKAAGVQDHVVKTVADYRRLHADLYARRQAGKLNPLELRRELVSFYSRHGQRQLDARFFADD